MPKFIKKPVAVEAVRYTCPPTEEFKRFINAGGERKVTIESGGAYIETLEGTMKADEGDMVVRGVCGELYPSKPVIFKKTYYTEDEYAALGL